MALPDYGSMSGWVPSRSRKGRAARNQSWSPNEYEWWYAGDQQAPAQQQTQQQQQAPAQQQTSQASSAASGPYAQPSQSYALGVNNPAQTQQGQNNQTGFDYTVTQPAGYQGPLNTAQTTADHPFFDPNSNYALPGHSYEVLPGMGQPGNNAFNNWATDNPEGYYYAILNERGLGGTDARSQVAQGMFRDTARGYQAAKMRNMALWYPEYLAQWDPEQVLAHLSNEQLGIDESRFRNRSRWGMRSG